MVNVRPGADDPEALHIFLYFAWFSLSLEGEYGSKNFRHEIILKFEF